MFDSLARRYAQGPVSEYMGTPEQVAALNAWAGHKVDLEALAQAHVCAIAGKGT
jgi:hypothetical protein